MKVSVLEGVVKVSVLGIGNSAFHFLFLPLSFLAIACCTLPSEPKDLSILIALKNLLIALSPRGRFFCWRRPLAH